MEKTHWKKAYKSDYLSSSDIDDKDLILTITKVVYQECVTQSGKKFCNVAHFKEDYKPMILNVGNAKIVKKFAGNKPHIDDWNNISIQVYVKPDVKFAGDTVEGLRIRTIQPKTSKPELLPNTDQWKAAKEYLVKDGSTIEKVKAKYSISSANETKIMQEVMS